MGILKKSLDEVSMWHWLSETEFDVKPWDMAIEIFFRVVESPGMTVLFRPHSIGVEWAEGEVGVSRMASKILFVSRMSKGSLVSKIEDSCPVAIEGATPRSLIFHGLGDWLSPSGEVREEFDLLKLRATMMRGSIAIDVETNHDIWAENDFFGNRHHEIYEQNAPRLAVGLQAVEDALGAIATPGEPTFFGTPYNYGVRVRKAEDGSGIDVSDHL